MIGADDVHHLDFTRADDVTDDGMNIVGEEDMEGAGRHIYPHTVRPFFAMN